jgi:hypothetical protein
MSEECMTAVRIQYGCDSDHQSVISRIAGEVNEGSTDIPMGTV